MREFTCRAALTGGAAILASTKPPSALKLTPRYRWGSSKPAAATWENYSPMPPAYASLRSVTSTTNRSTMLKTKFRARSVPLPIAITKTCWREPISTPCSLPPTPVLLHPEHFVAAVQLSKHIYCEKPAGADVAGVTRLVRAAKNADASKVIQFGFQQR